MSERLRHGLQLRNKLEIGTGPPKGKDQAARVTVSAPAAPGCQENRQAEAEASPEGEVSRHKRQPADRRECRAGGPGSGPTVSGAQWRDPLTS